MSLEPDFNSLSAEVSLKKDAHRAKLIEKAKGRGLFSWIDLVFLLPVLIFGYVALSGGEKLQRETLAVFASLIMIVQWSIMRLTMRLNSLVQYLLEQPETHAAQQGASGDAQKAGRP